MNLGERHLVWRAELTARGAARARRRRLLRELADYRTAAQREDLLASVERCPNAAREEVRRLLARATAPAELDHPPYHLLR